MKFPSATSSGRGGCDCLPRPEPAAPESSTDAHAPIAFLLRYRDAWFGMEKRVTFEAEGVAAALAMMEREPIGEWAELSSGGDVICRRGREPSGAADYWVVD